MPRHRPGGRRGLSAITPDVRMGTMDPADERQPYEHLLYVPLDEGTIVRIVLNRPKYRNAQHRPLLLELDDAFLRAEADDTARVVVLSGAGTMFSSGHDMGT